MPGAHRPLAERLWEKGQRDPSGCLIWQGATNGRYGRIGRGGRDGGDAYAHRVAYELAHGPIPEGMQVCHRCDVPRCIEPTHLFAGTARDNAQDMITKGRKVSAKKLTDEQVRQIRALCASGAQHKAVAAQFGVTNAHVSNLLHRKRRQAVA